MYLLLVFGFFVVLGAIAGNAEEGIEVIAMHFQGQKIGKIVRFNCTFEKIPVLKTVELLIDDITAVNVREYNGECYLTHIGKPCNLSECQCSQDGKNYFWVYEEHIKDSFTATCQAKFTCIVHASIQFTDTILSPQKVTSEKCDTRTTTITTTTTTRAPPPPITTLKPNIRPILNDATCYTQGSGSVLLYCTCVVLSIIIKMLR